MNRRFSLKPSTQWSVLTLLLLVAAAMPAFSQWDNSNWGLVVAPVYGSSETGFYSGAELFAGPNKFGSYFAGVAPNGRKLTPAGITAQTGMNPLGIALTPDGKYLITSNDDEREGGLPSFKDSKNVGGYSLNVIDTATMTVKSQMTTGKFFIGLQVTGTGPYTVWASGGVTQQMLLYTVQSDGSIAAGPTITISPITPSTAGYVSNYTPDAHWNQADQNGNKPPVPTNFDRVNGAKTTFPAGSALSPDGKWLYVACNGDNSVAVIDTTQQKVVRQVQVGFFPYTVAVSNDGSRVMVSNWGVMEYKFNSPTYDGNGKLSGLGSSGNDVFGYFVPPTTAGKSASVSVLSAPGGDGSQLMLVGAVDQGAALDKQDIVGDTHPSAMGVVFPTDSRRGTVGQVLYVAQTNSDTIGLIDVNTGQAIGSLDLSLFPGKPTKGTQPNAIVVSPSGTRVYIAEAGINSVAVLDSTNPGNPKLLGRIPTDWYPTAVTLSADGNTLYIANAKGVGEDINPNTKTNIFASTSPPTGLVSTPQTDSNYIFGTVQKVDVNNINLDDTTVRSNNYKTIENADTSVVPVGGEASPRVKHVIFILHENKTFDSMLGNVKKFGKFSSLNYNAANGSYYYNGQYTGVSLNTQALASTFAAGVNYYSDSEESDAGHQFAASGMATDYTEKTLLVKSGRGLLVNKNFEPEDYPFHGYIFNNAARNGVSFREYGVFAARTVGSDTGTNTPTTLNDPPSGLAGAPKLQDDNFHITKPLINLGDVSSPTQGLGQSFFMVMPGLSIMGDNNANGVPHIDRNYPGYNFNISDQRRAKHFIEDFDQMVANNTLPQFIYLYQPNDHTGSIQAPNKDQVFGPQTGVQLVGDGDVGLGMVVKHIMESPVYYDKDSNTGVAIIMTYDDAQSSLDHIHPHRTPVIVMGPFAKPGYMSTRHYNTASVVKTEELLLGLPPNNLGDLMATDLRDFFQPTANGITSNQINWNLQVNYVASKEGTKIWKLVDKLDTVSGPDRDSHRLGTLNRLSLTADELHKKAAKEHKLNTTEYKKQQAKLYQMAVELVSGNAPKDND